MAAKRRCEIPFTHLAPAKGHEDVPDILIDGAMKEGMGSWCYMCRACHAVYGYGLGIGKGLPFTQVPLGDTGGWKLEKLTELPHAASK